MKLNKRGVSIFETLIAMAVILAVTVTAITIVSNFSRISGSMLSHSEALTSAENALEAFKYADSLGEFDSLMYRVSTGMFTKDTFDLPQKTEEGLYTRGYAIYTKGDGYYSVRIRVVYTYTSESGTALFSAEVTSASGVTIYSVDNYRKAVKPLG